MYTDEDQNHKCVWCRIKCVHDLRDMVRINKNVTIVFVARVCRVCNNRTGHSRARLTIAKKHVVIV